MSSFTIEKKEYMKAAGICAGIAEATANSTRGKLWIYDYETQRNMTDADYIRRFADCYEKNRLSVMEQYGDADMGHADENSYTDDFLSAKRIGKRAADDFYLRQNLIGELNMFFHSAIYQTEKESYAWALKTFFGEIISALVYITNREESESWGALDIEKYENHKNEWQRII